MAEFDIAYCGPAPGPAGIAGAWNLDPPLVVALAVAALIAARLPERRSAWAGVALLAVAFLSPLCTLGSALFSARVAHHLLIVAAAAPLLARALPLIPGAPGAWFAAHAAALWLWHAPGPYDWALGHIAAYWLMQATLLGTALGLWSAILRPGARLEGALVLLVGTVAQMGLLAALIVFAPWPLHAAHLLTTAPWGLTPLADQQLAGLLMWAPGLLPYLAAGLVLTWRAAAAGQAAR